jgi:hypothetical protein
MYKTTYDMPHGKISPEVFIGHIQKIINDTKYGEQVSGT